MLDLLLIIKFLSNCYIVEGFKVPSLTLRPPRAHEASRRPGMGAAGPGTGLALPAKIGFDRTEDTSAPPPLKGHGKGKKGKKGKEGKEKGKWGRFEPY